MQSLIIYSVTDGLSSEHTKRSYLKNFRQFLQFAQTDERTLAEEARTDPRAVEALIINHIQYLAEKRELTHGSIKTHCFSIFHFLEMNDISLNTRKIRRFLPPDEGMREDRTYTREEIASML
jgi:hypothetical protein